LLSCIVAYIDYPIRQPLNNAASWKHPVSVQPASTC